MSRPVKQGLDYFPMDVTTDDKFELIEAKHGLIGFAIILKLYQKIYKEGCYLEWSEEKLLIFKKTINVDINLITDVINDAMKYNIFNNDVYTNYNVLTSSGIQKRFFTACDRRKVVDLVKNYIIVDINEVNVNINWINDNNKYTKESKVKESIVKESKEDKYPFIDFWNLYDKKVDRQSAEKKYNKLSDSEKEQILKSLPNYVKSTPDVKFRKHPDTYLNNRCWEDEIVTVKPQMDLRDWMKQTGAML